MTPIAVNFSHRKALARQSAIRVTSFHDEAEWPPLGQALHHREGAELKNSPESAAKIGRMQLPPNTGETVEAALAQYLESSPADATFARRHSALRLYAGWTGAIYLTTTGQFLFVDEEANPPRIETDLNTKSEVLALVVASETFPELAKLLPLRPCGATTCCQCDGTGRVILGATHSLVCGQCTGLGWLWSEQADAEDDGDYPQFETAVARFRSFASGHGHGSNLRFVDCSKVLVLRCGLYARIDSPAISTANARIVYEAAVARRLGVQISAIAKVASGELLAFIYGPDTISQAEALMYPNGLKMSIPLALPAARVVGSATFEILRIFGGRRTQRNTHEWLKFRAG